MSTAAHPDRQRRGSARDRPGPGPVPARPRRRGRGTRASGVSGVLGGGTSGSQREADKAGRRRRPSSPPGRGPPGSGTPARRPGGAAARRPGRPTAAGRPSRGAGCVRGPIVERLLVEGSSSPSPTVRPALAAGRSMISPLGSSSGDRASGWPGGKPDLVLDGRPRASASRLGGLASGPVLERRADGEPGREAVGPPGARYARGAGRGSA